MTQDEYSRLQGRMSLAYGLENERTQIETLLKMVTENPMICIVTQLSGWLSDEFCRHIAEEVENHLRELLNDNRKRFCDL